MNEHTNSSLTKTPYHKECAVLRLPSPPDPWKATEWYGSTIAGVPFLLRNILTLQRCGLHDIIVYMDTQDLKSLKILVGQDFRITSNVHWVSNPEKLTETLKNLKSRVLLFNGSALHDKKEVNSVLDKTGTKNSKSPERLDLNHEQLESLVDKIQTNAKAEHEHFTEDQQTFLSIPGPAKDHILEHNDFNILHEQLLKGSGQNHDSTITRLLSRPVSRKLSRFFLITPISPNQITLLSFVMGLLAAFCFFQGTYLANVYGGILLVFSTWVDGVDGEIARLKFMESELGGKLDILCDNIVHFLVFGAIGWGMSKATGEQLYIYFGILAAFASLTSFFLLGSSIVNKSSGDYKPSSKSQPSLADKLANRDFIHFLMLTTVFDLVHIFISIAAVGATIFAAYLIYIRSMELYSVKCPERS